MKRGRNVGSWYHDAPYGAYALTDCHIVLSMNDPVRLAEALDSDPLRDLVHIDRYDERELYAEAVAAELSKLDFASVAGKFDAAGIWFERVQDYDDLRVDPQSTHLGALPSVEIRGQPVTIVAHPLQYDGSRPGIRRIPLEPGCDGRTILAEHGFSDLEIDRLAADGIIGLPRDVESESAAP